MRRILSRSVIQRALLAVLALILALAPISGAAAATMDEELSTADVEATEAPATEAPATEAAEQAPATEPTEEAPAEEAPVAPAEEPTEPVQEEVTATESTEDVAAEPEPEPAANDPTDEEGGKAAAEAPAVEEDAELEAGSHGGGLTRYGTRTDCVLIDALYTDGHPEHFLNCTGEKDVTTAEIPTLHVAVLHMSCSDAFDGGGDGDHSNGITGVFEKGDPTGPDGTQHVFRSVYMAKVRLDAAGNITSEDVCLDQRQNMGNPDVAIDKWILDAAGNNAETRTVPAGTTVTWRIQVRNTGDVVLTNLAVTDPNVASCARPTLVASLAVGATHPAYTCTSVATANLVNTATVTTAEGVTANDNAQVVVQTPNVAIDKWVVGPNDEHLETREVMSGSTVTWRIRVRNTGDQQLTNVRVSDANAPRCVKDIGTMAIGAFVEYDCVLANVTADMTNVAVVHTDQTPNKQDDASVTVKIITPVLTAQWTCPTPGQGSAITGTTNVPLQSVTLNFDRNGGSETFTTNQTGNFSFAGTLANAGKVISSAEIVSSASSLNRTITPTAAQMAACYTDAPAINIDKRPLNWDGTGTETQAVVSGETARWLITVKNIGNVTLTNVVVDDPLARGCDITQGFTLVPQESRVYTCSQANVTAGFTNVAKATGTPPVGNPVSDDDPSPVTVTPVLNPQITITKQHTLNPFADPQTVVSGGTATWVIVVTNNGNMTLNNVTVTDQLAPNCNRSVGTLAPGQSAAPYSCSLANVTQSFTNRADVVGTTPAPDSRQVTDSDTAPVSVIPQLQNPSVLLRKTAAAPECPKVGDLVTYRFEIVNNGSTTLNNITVNDPLLGGAVTLPASTLPAGQTMNATATYALTQANLDAGSLSNSATANAQSANTGAPVTPSTSQAVVMLEDCPDIELIKDGPATAQVGEQITYTFTVTNNGSVTLTNVRIFDERLGIDGLLVNPSTLAPGQQGTAAATYTVTEEDGDDEEILNVAFVRARTPDGTEIDDEDDHITTIPRVPEAPEPGIRLVKDGPAIANEGETITYRFTVTNTGDVTLTNVNITDPLLGLDRLTVRPSTLAPDEQGTATATYVITPADADAGSVYNTAVARGTAPDGTRVRDRDDHTVIVPLVPPAVPPRQLPPPELPATGLGSTGFALTALLSLALGGVLLGIAGSGNLQAAMAGATVNADSPMLAMLRRWNLAPKPGGSQARRRRHH